MIISLPQFEIGAKSKVGEPWFQLKICLNSKLGQNFKLEYQEFSRIRLEHQEFQLQICPNFKLGHRLSWAPVISTLNLPQLQTGAMVKLDISGSNFEFAPTSNWGNGQVGAPVV